MKTKGGLLFITIAGVVVIVIIFIGIFVFGTAIMRLGNDHGDNVPTPTAHYCYWDYSLNETDHLDTYYYPGNESKFVVVTLKVVNNDTEPFDNNPYFWKLTVNQISYDVSFYTFAAKEINYRSVEVQYQGTYTWKIVFELPKTGTYLGGIQITYDSWYGPTMRFNPYLL